MRRYNIIFAVLAAASILVLGCFVYYLQDQVGTLSQQMKSLSRELNDTEQEFNDLNSSLQHSLTLRTFNFTIVLSDTTNSEQGINYSSWGESAALENVTLVSAANTANNVSLSDLIMGSSPLDVYDLGFPYSKYWVSHPIFINPLDPNHIAKYYHPTLKVDTYGYGFHAVLMQSTEPVIYENQNSTTAVTYYVFRGQVDLLYSTFAQNTTFYLTLHSFQTLSMIEPIEGWYKTVPLPS